jgi:hypothetical protein
MTRSTASAEMTLSTASAEMTLGTASAEMTRSTASANSGPAGRRSLRSYLFIIDSSFSFTMSYRRRTSASVV